ncbi:MAG: helix-turn-helix transcriptional regulator [Oscillospiraceae bacterium]|nr:helix-turn-helix transcriptional regulator [Oscillospiraceae bacterium]
MYALDKERFGEFVSCLRREKGLTQKELADKLYVSNKAVSKWERGLSLPDVGLLILLAQALDVSVTELLEGCRMESAEAMEPAQVEKLVRQAIGLAEGERLVRPGLREYGSYLGAVAMAVMETALLLAMGISRSLLTSYLLTPLLLAAGFGAYFWLMSRERLPDYYDANDIHFYSHGPVRINLPGVRFNNRNWPHILRVVRWWSVGMLTLWPVICGLLHWLLPELWHRIGLFVTLAATLGGLFVPICIAAKKYE